MFGKLLKHDFKAVFRYWWLLLPAVPVLSVAIGLAIRLLLTTELAVGEYPIIHILLILFISFAFVALAASTMVTPILSLVRFYKHFYTDEGYLTFTLPVRRRTLFLSKIVNASIFNAMYLLLMVFSVSAAVVCAVPSDILADFFLAFGKMLEGLKLLGAWNVIYFAEWIALFVAIDLFATLLLYLCVTIGALVVRKAKLVVGLAIYYGVNTAISSVLQILTSIVLPLTSGELVVMLEKMTPLAFALVLLIFIAAVATLAFTLFSMTLGRLEKKLNLA